MKRVKSFIKLTNRNSEHLNEKELNRVTGGLCVCGCFYSNCGGSSNADNNEANDAVGIGSNDPTDDAEWNGAEFFD